MFRSGLKSFGNCDSLRLQIATSAPIWNEFVSIYYLTDTAYEHTFTADGTQVLIRVIRQDAAVEGSMHFFMKHFVMYELTEQQEWVKVSDNGYRYAFNGKEQDPSWNGVGKMCDSGFRIYNPRIAKFLSVYLFAPEYPWIRISICWKYAYIGD